MYCNHRLAEATTTTPPPPTFSEGKLAGPTLKIFRGLSTIMQEFRNGPWKALEEFLSRFERSCGLKNEMGSRSRGLLNVGLV